MSSTENTATEKRDVYASVTAQIATVIEQGAGMELVGTAWDMGADVVPSPSLEQAREFIRASSQRCAGITRIGASSALGGDHTAFRRCPLRPNQ